MHSVIKKGWFIGDRRTGTAIRWCAGAAALRRGFRLAVVGFRRANVALRPLKSFYDESHEPLESPTMINDFEDQKQNFCNEKKNTFLEKLKNLSFYKVPREVLEKIISYIFHMNSAKLKSLLWHQKKRQKQPSKKKLHFYLQIKFLLVQVFLKYLNI